MKRKASLAVVFALCAALAVTGAVAAKDHSAHGASDSHASGHGSGSLSASLTTKGNASHPGGVFRILAVLHAPQDLRPPTVNEVVHFASGDIAVVLTRSGKGAAYHGNVPVPAGEPAGVVKIDAAALVNGATLTATGSGKIVIETTTKTSETTTEPPATSTTCTATTTEAVTTSLATTASEASTATETTDTGSCDNQSADSPSFVLTPQSIREFIALLAALIN